MKQRSLISMVTLLTITMSGCTQQPSRQITKQINVETKQQLPTKPKESFDLKLDEVLESGANLIEIRGLEKNYKEGEKLSFVVDTKGQVGYLYIMSVDDSSVTVLQPNPDSPLEQMRGKRSFPEDFTDGAFYIKTVKNCKSCQKEKTSIYALLTKEPIEGIQQKIVDNKLLSFHKNSQQATRAMRGVERIHVKTSGRANLSIGKTEFFVE